MAAGCRPEPKRRGRVEWIVQRHTAEVEGDLQHYFRIDLRDLYRPRGGPSRLTWRRLANLVDWLPTDSATKTAIRDSLSDNEIAELAEREPVGYGRWSRGDLRTAGVEDAVNMQTAVVVWLAKRLIARDESAKLKIPEPVRRPGIAAKKKPALSAEGRAYLDYLRANQGALPPGYTLMAAN